MSQYPPEKIYAAARTLLPILKPDVRRQVEDLLTQAERGADTHLHLLDLLTRDEATRRQLRDLLKSEDVAYHLGEYSGLSGEQYVTKAGDKFACPHCDYRYPIGEDGEQPVPCKQHPKARLEKAPPEEGA